jgi:carbon-monoxide dehydrogenase medium subunit
MYAPDFEYYRANSVAEAGQLLANHPGAKLLAGGHSLIPLLKLRLANPTGVVDIGRIAELREITVRDGTVRIGALTTHAELAASKALRDACPMLAEAAGLIGDPTVRNRGTIGGNVVHADPASDPPIVLTALGARFSVTGPRGQRTVEVGEFFQGLMTTALAENEILTAVEIPARQAGQGMAYVKFSHPASRYAVVAAAAAVTVSAGKCSAAQVAVGGLIPRPTRAASVEKALVGQSLSPEAMKNAAEQVSRDLGDDILGDIFASAEYRRAMASVYVKRALAAASQRAS